MTPTIQEKINDIASVKDDIRVEIVGKGATLPLNSSFEDYPDAIRSIVNTGPTVKEPVIHGVNYYDYKGDVVWTYTVDEFLALPQHPPQTGSETLKGDGWNWSLADAKDFIRNKFDLLNIGGQYVTKDGASRIYLDIPDDLEGETLFFQVAYNTYNPGQLRYLTIDWGDGTVQAMHIAASTNESVNSHTEHIYENPGKYVIKIMPDEGLYYGFGNGSTTAVINSFGADVGFTHYSETGYRGCRQWIKAIECGKNFLFQKSGFVYYGLNCEYVSIPHLVKPTTTYPTETIITNRFSYARSLKAVIYPEGLTAPSANTTQPICQYCDSIRVLSLPKSYTPKMAVSGWMRECCSLDSLVLPDGMVANQATAVNTYTYMGAANTNIKRIYIGSSVPGTTLMLPNYGFYQMFSLKDVTVPSGYIRTGQDGFGYDYALETVDLPSTISYINNYTFRDCYNLQKIIMRRTSVPSLQSASYPFNNVNYATIWVPASAYTTYVTATGNWVNHDYKIRKIGVEYGFGEMTDEYIKSDKTYVDSSTYKLSGYIPVTAGHVLKCSNGVRASGSGCVGVYDTNGQILSATAVTTAGTSITLPSDAAYVRLSCYMNHKNICCVFDDTAGKLIYPVEGNPKYMIFEDLDYYYDSGGDTPDQGIFYDILAWLNTQDPNEYDEITNNMQMDESFLAYMELLADEYSGIQIKPNCRVNQHSGCKIYQSWGNTMEIDGKTYYIWEAVRTVSNGIERTETDPYYYKYVLTDTYNIDELNKFSYLEYAKIHGDAYMYRNPNYQDDYPVRYTLEYDNSILYTQTDPSTNLLASELIAVKEGVYTWYPWYTNPADEN